MIRGMAVAAARKLLSFLDIEFALQRTVGFFFHAEGCPAAFHA